MGLGASVAYLENMNINLVKAHQVKAVMDLYGYDHAFLTPEGAEHFTKPFGFTAHLYIEKAEPTHPKGLNLPDGMKEAKGVAADHLALQIAHHLNVSVPDMFGRGSQLRIACTKILEHLTKKDPSPEKS